MAFIFQQILFFVSIILVLFVPGYFLILAVWGQKRIFHPIEKFVISFGLSIIICDFSMILMGKAGILFTRLSIILAIVIFSAVCYLIYRNKTKSLIEAETIFSFSKNQRIAIILILFLTIFIKTIYLTNSIFPTSTDLGRHTYWSKSISETGKLPIYQEQDIIKVGDKYEISQPEKIIDFIIGEHLIFSAINLVSGNDFVSSFPSLVLLLINIFVILAVFILALRLFGNLDIGKNASILALFLLGPLYAISSDQAKFVSGGVTGNLLGNLLIPLSFYFYYRAFREKNSVFMSFAVFFTAGLIYTHHLSAFVFAYSVLFALLIFFLFNFHQIGSYLKNWLKLIFRFPVILSVIFIILFLLIYTPNYIGTKAADEALGSPEKTTRTGLTFLQLKYATGEPRIILGIAGLVLILFTLKRKTYEGTLLSGWALTLLIMSLKPQFLFLNINSDRISNYTTYPIVLLGGFFLASLLSYFPLNSAKKPLNKNILLAFCLLILIFIFTNGYYDNSLLLKEATDAEKALQTFHASGYLKKQSNESDNILKDHNYINADSMIRLYFMRDLNFPFSRGYFKRYEDEFSPREMCTLWMISTPNTAEGKKCFADLSINFVMVNPKYDGAQFNQSKDFSNIYSGDNIGIYYRHK